MPHTSNAKLLDRLTTSVSKDAGNSDNLSSFISANN